MIHSDGIIFEDDYYRYIYGMDERKPEGMDRVVAVVLALDIAKRPIERSMRAADLETATNAEIRAFRKQFAKIDEEEPDPLPLQIFDGDVAVRRTVNQLEAAGVGGIITVCAEEILDEVEAALAGSSAVVVAYEPDQVDAIDAKSDGIQIELVSRGQIIWTMAQLRSLDRAGTISCPSGEFDSFMFVHADHVNFEPRHYQRLRTVYEEDESVDFVCAYVEWRPGVPLLVPRRYAAELAEPVSGKLPRAQGAAQQACRLHHARFAIMDEDRMFGPNPTIVAAQDPNALPASALATVSKARYQTTPYELKVAQAAGKKPDPHVVSAKKFLARLDEALAEHPIEGLDEADAWAMRNRADFPLLAMRDNAGLAYLDAAATSLRPASVINACDEFALHYDANVWRGMYGNSMYATASYQKAREKVAAFLNADPREIIFTANTTTSLNLVAQAWAQQNLHEGDLMLVMCNEHHSNMLPWQEAAKTTGGTVEFIPIDHAGRVDWARYEELLARGPRLVAAAQVSNVIGLENPIRKMAKAAHKVGAVFVVDAAQSSPHMAIDVQKLGIDFLALSGHKLHAPTGVGVLWAHSDRIREMKPVQVGGGTISAVSYEGTYWRQAPYAFEPGTPPIEGIIGMGTAVDYLERLGMDKVEQHVRVMSDYALRVMSLIPGVTVLGNHAGKDGNLGVLSYTFNRLESIQISILLAKMGVAVRSGGHCAVHLALALGLPGTTRISFGPYTTKADIEAWGFAMSLVAELAEHEVPRS